ncbi:hypothetical protein B0A67_13120 [Flavobacterium aquidurense]|jgi:hypothetical protein|uniref:hypothetical protein n=1 Tax=Flavobacterium aquidurense TaxID=362413 RepID=UPI00091CF01D|nr:hypothetical protein [Flavobacterium aquidurense]OXA71199.1 hypothetical protein B0A67_13120 [Flavobacterium aquidurense]SHG67952.1 hypothetical protein SAMN05444481_106172 [Flavobacterium frigidimaris]
MSKKNQIAIGKIIAKKITVSSTKQKSVDNRSNQLNPNNTEYLKSHLKSNTKVNAKKNDDSDWDDDNFGDDWEFNHD